ncbi:MAG: hypothetical protein JNL11_12410 [Bdellovibrionaceae bacterium]|nr:hypothetical protein [Pseudobdellovibrionaceae bacterium]
MIKIRFYQKFLVFCSTWNIIVRVLLLFFLGFLLACEKNDPKPELRDLIYQDMLEQHAEAERIYKETDTKISDVRKNSTDSKPQSGLHKKADRQIFEMLKLKTKLEQQMSYWKIRSFERLKYVRLKANKSKEPYVSDPQEWEVYKSEKKLRVAKNAWDLKARFQETGFQYNPVLLGEDPGDLPAKPKPASGESGGHH